MHKLRMKIYFPNQGNLFLNRRGMREAMDSVMTWAEASLSHKWECTALAPRMIDMANAAATLLFTFESEADYVLFKMRWA